MDTEKRKQRVLLVDGDSRVLRFLSIKLRSAGYDVSTAAHGAAALDTAARLRPEIVILASPVAAEASDLAGQLHERLSCPVIIYGGELFNPPKTSHQAACTYIEKSYETDEFVRQVKSLLAAASPTQ